MGHWTRGGARPWSWTWVIPVIAASLAWREILRFFRQPNRIVGSIGLKVFSHRKRMGLSLQQLGERSDVSAAAIHKIEQGGMVPTITTLLKLATALGRPVSYFVEEDVGQDDVARIQPCQGTLRRQQGRHHARPADQRPEERPGQRWP